MASGARDSFAAGGSVSAGAPAAPGALPAALEGRRQRVAAVVLDVARLALVALVGGLAQRLRGGAGVPLAALEVEVRDALLRLGAALLEEVVRLRGTGARGPSYVCPCGVRLVLKELAPLQQRTWFGPITLERAVYAGAGCRVRAHRVPLDAAWGLLGAAPAAGLPDPPGSDGGVLVPAPPGGGPARLAPAFAALVVEFGARLPYAEAARLLAAALGPAAALAPNTVRAYTQAAGRARQEAEDEALAARRRLTRGEARALSGRGTPPRPAPAPDVLAVALDGALERTRAGGKEVKLGAVWDLRPPRPWPAPAPGDTAEPPSAAPAPLVPGPTTYAATLAPAEAFGRQLHAVAQRRGLGWARRGVVLGDGAKWIWRLAARRFPGAVQIVDWYHAREHLWALAQLLYGEGTAAAWAWLETVAGELWLAATPADVAVVALAAADAWAAPPPPGAPRRTKARRLEVAKAVAYFAGNAPRLRYAAVRAAGLPVGSGVVEGGCRSVLHARLKRPGARWAAPAAEHLARARAVLCSDPAPVCGHPADRLAA
jgi:hypothetical protein